MITIEDAVAWWNRTSFLDREDFLSKIGADSMDDGWLVDPEANEPEPEVLVTDGVKIKEMSAQDYNEYCRKNRYNAKYT